jgi:GNAT superfamily N-acetyltransferase
MTPAMASSANGSPRPLTIVTDQPIEEISLHGVGYRLAVLRGVGLAPLVPFLRATYQRRDFTLDWLTRKYGGTFGGLAGFSYVALTERGEAVASCGMLPWPVQCGARVELAAQVVDVATHPDHRRRGLFRRLTEMAHARCVQNGVSFFIAFPHRNGDSYPGFVGALGYIDAGLQSEFRWPIRTLWAERLARRAGAARPYRWFLERTLRALAPADPVFENSLIREGFAATRRDRSFYAYKAFAGSRVVQLAGGRVWMKIRHGIQIGDIEAESPRDIERTVRALETLALRLGTHQIALHTANNTRLERFLESRYAHGPSVSLVYRNVCSEIPVDQLRFSLGDLDNF